ncbi:hypothetical protein [Candidatus Albibeggiatoa sp. nov. NOAA]|uniref:hypothetical protein n=1 Tax=Candidatus Albibeggiatoa sp. nov. NOAA TaxID=3162724 RepID=UPI0032FF5C16|nr:hypothetical protein [Thiotrichaceae bacterium]
MKIEKYGAGVFSMYPFLSVAECRKLIEKSENMTYEKATIQAIAGEKLDEEIRFNDRILFDDVELADQLYQKAKQYLPEIVDSW